MRCGGARSGRARAGGAGRDAAGSPGSAEKSPAALRRVAHFRQQLKAPAPPPPAPVAGRPAWAEGLFVSKLP